MSLVSLSLSLSLSLIEKKIKTLSYSNPYAAALTAIGAQMQLGNLARGR